MKKLRTVLVLLLALTASLALFACKGGGGDDAEDPDQAITGVRSISGFDSTITDSLSEEEWRASLNADTDLKINVRRKNGESDTLTAADCTITTTAVFGETGNYTVTFTPTKDNSGNQSITETLTIDHDWEEGTGGVSTCKHDQATRVVQNEDVIIHYGTFHNGTVDQVPGDLADDVIPGVNRASSAVYSNIGTNSVIKEFGTVKSNRNATNGGTVDEYSVAVPTLTAGKLEKGMKITLRGQARTTTGADQYWGHADETWNVPLAGIADRNANGINTGASAKQGFIGGASVIVRQEGWVLYDGFKNDAACYLGAIGGGVKGGTQPYPNYGSHNTAVPDPSKPAPEGYVNGLHPDFDSADWKDWWVYSEGNEMHSGDHYQDWHDIEISYEYMLDHDIVVITFTNNYKSSSALRLTAYIKVPEPTAGYFDTILHGDYSDMVVTESEVVTRRTPTAFTYDSNTGYNGETVYAEGRTFNFDAISATASYKQSSAPETKKINPGEVYAYVGSATKDAVLADVRSKIDTTGESTGIDVTNGDWQQIGETDGLKASYQVFIVQINMGNKAWTAVLNKTDGSLPFTIVPNVIDTAEGMDVTVDEVSFPNDGNVGNFSFDVASDKITLTLAGGFAHQLTTEQVEKLGTTTASRYIAIRLNKIADTSSAFSASNVEVKAGNTALKSKVVLDGGNAYVVIALTKDDAAKDITITGLQPTPVVLKVSDLGGFIATADHDVSGAGAINEDGTITVKFNVGTANAEKWSLAATGAGQTRLGPQDLAYGAGDDANNLNIEWCPTLTLMKVTGEATGAAERAKIAQTGIVQITFKLKAQAPNSYAATTITLYLDGKAEMASTVYHDFSVKGGVTSAGYGYAAEGLNANVNGTRLTVSKVVKAENLTDEALTGSVLLNINKGDKEAAKLLPLNIGYKSENGVITVLGDAADYVSASVNVFGTVNDSADKDKGAVIVFSVDLSKLGARTGSEDVYFQLGDQATKAESVVKVHGTSYELVELSGKTLVPVSIVDGTCMEEGIAGYEYRENDNVLCFVGLTRVGGEHRFEDNVCTLCGATQEEDSVSFELLADAYSATLETGKFITVSGKLNDVAHGEIDNDPALWTGVNMQITTLDGTVYLVRPDNCIAVNDVVTPEADNFERFAPQGIGNITDGISGLPIADADFQKIKQSGSFVYTVAFEDGVVTTTLSFFASDNATRTPNAKFWFKFKGIPGGQVGVKVYIDEYGSTGVRLDGNADKVEGEVAPSMIDEISGSVTAVSASNNVTGTQIAGTSGKAVVAVSGVAGKMTDAIKNAAKITGTHYLALSISLTGALPDPSAVNLLDEEGNALAGYAAISADKKTIEVVVGLSGSEKFFDIDLVNIIGSSLQSDIRVDLAALRYYDVNATVSAGTTSFLYGGDVDVQFTAGSGATIPSGAKIRINGETAALSNGTTVAGLTVKNWASNKLTLTVPAATLTEKVPSYLVELVDENGVLVARTDLSAIVAIPSTVKANENKGDGYLVRADGSDLYIVFVDSDDSNLHLGASKAIVLNANKGKNSKVELINNYDLTAKIDLLGNVSFGINKLAAETVGVYSEVGARRVLAVKVPLSVLEIGASDAYGYDLRVGDDAALDGYFTVAASDRAIAKKTASTSGAKASIAAHTCDTLGVKGYKVESDTFYYDLEFERTHTFTFVPNGNGISVCSVCGAVAREDESKAFVIPGDKLATKETGKTLVDTGVSVSFLANVGGNDWGAAAVTTGAGNVIITLPNLDPWNNSVAGDAAASTEEKALAAKVVSANKTPQGFEQNGASWNVFLNDTSYVTITISKTDGIVFYKNGVQVVNYPASSEIGTGTVGDMAELMLRLFSRGGLAVGNGLNSVTDVLVEPKAYTAAEATARYSNYLAEESLTPIHTHSWQNGGSDKCTCGMVNPNHSDHEYNESTHVCDVCGHFAPESDDIHTFENGVCSCGLICTHSAGLPCEYCGATLTDTTEADVDELAVWGTATNDYTLALGGRVTITATQTSVGNMGWNGLVARLNTPDVDNAFFVRPDGLASFPWAWHGVSFAEKNVAISGVTYKASAEVNTGNVDNIKTYMANNAKVKMELTLSKDGVLTCVYSISSSENVELFKWTATVSGLTSQSYTVCFANDKQNTAEGPAAAEFSDVHVVAGKITFNAE